MENEDATEPTSKWLSTKAVIAYAVVGVLLVIGIIVLAVNMTSTDDPSKAQTSQFKNWLKPESEIKIGDNRYVSACSALPLTTVTDVFGKLTGQTFIQEDYLDTSVNDSTEPLDLKCRYYPALSGGTSVTLSTEQSVDASDAKDIGFSLGVYDESEVQIELDKYTKALKANPDKDVEKFVDQLKSSFETFKKHKSEIDKDFVLPVSETISGSMNTFSLVSVHNNVVYRLGYTPAGKNEDSKLSDQELIDGLKKMQKGMKAVSANISNTSLDQSPAPTILGTTDKYGTTTILEPCAIMSSGAFTGLNSGVEQTDPVDRSTVSIDFTTKYYTTADKSLILPQNECTRQAETAKSKLTLAYGSSAKQAQEWLDKHYVVDAADTKLQTSADWAVSFQNPVAPTDPPIIVFRTGAYIGTLSLQSGADDTEATQDQYVQAINTLTPLIKKAAADASK